MVIYSVNCDQYTQTWGKIASPLVTINTKFPNFYGLRLYEKLT